jgi:hypothetical protein
MSSSRAQRATLVAPLNVRIAPSPHLAYRLPTELPRRTKLSQDVVSAGHVVTPLVDQRARAHFAVIMKTATVALVRRHIEAQHGPSESRLHPWHAPNWVEGKFHPEIAAEHMGENRPIGSRARPLAVRSAMREP